MQYDWSCDGPKGHLTNISRWCVQGANIAGGLLGFMCTTISAVESKASLVSTGKNSSLVQTIGPVWTPGRCHKVLTWTFSFFVCIWQEKKKERFIEKQENTIKKKKWQQTLQTHLPCLLPLSKLLANMRSLVLLCSPTHKSPASHAIVFGGI